MKNGILPHIWSLHLQWFAIELQHLLHKHYMNGVALSQDSSLNFMSWLWISCSKQILHRSFKQTFYTLCLIQTVLEYLQQKSWIVSTKFLSLYMLSLSKCTFTWHFGCRQKPDPNLASLVTFWLATIQWLQFFGKNLTILCLSLHSSTLNVRGRVKRQPWVGTHANLHECFCTQFASLDSNFLFFHQKSQILTFS